MHSFPKFLLLVISNAIFFKFCDAQPLPDSTALKINQLFREWDKSNSPGCSVGLVRNDSLIFSKGYGIANLEYGLPVSDTTIFHVASVSKQFTAFCIVLLSRQGKLKLDDDIRKHLPWFPDLHHTITIRSLLNHTSGIRDQWQLLAIQGTRLDDVITEDHILKLLRTQRQLNFAPGEEYSYSNSNFSLSGEIVKSVTGQSLRQFADSAIFKPLGMKHTHFHDDYTEIVRNRADSYQRTDSAHFSNSILSYSTAGATSLFTTVSDMAKWISNFYDHKVGDQADIDTLTQKSKLNNGKELNYALGIVSDTHNGWRQFSHGGADAGFRTFVAALPDLKMGAVVFSNLGDFNTSKKAFEMLDLLVRDTASKQNADAIKIKDTTTAVLKGDSVRMKKYLGSYISDRGLELGIAIKNHNLYYYNDDQYHLMKRDSTDLYSAFDAPQIKFKFELRPRDTVITVTTSTDTHKLKKYDSSQRNEKSLQEYAGRYYSKELDCSYSITLKDNKLVLTNNKYNDSPLKLAGSDHLLTDFWWMNHLKLIRDKSGKITGFEINSNRIMHLRFDKMHN